MDDKLEREYPDDIVDAIAFKVKTIAPPPSREELCEKLAPREWLLSGGGGHEDGADGLRALSVSGEGLVEFLEDYRAYLRDETNLAVAGAYETCAVAAENHGALNGHLIGAAIAEEIRALPTGGK